MPSVSEKQRHLFAAAYSAKSGGKKRPKYVPISIWLLPLKRMKEFLNVRKKA